MYSPLGEIKQGAAWQPPGVPPGASSQAESEDRYRILLKHSQDLLCTHDLQGRLLSASNAAASLLGYSVEELLRIPMADFVAPEFRSQFDSYLSEIQRAGEARGLLAVMTRSGERRIWEYHNTLQTEGVEAPVVLGLAHDVTEQRLAQTLLQASEQRFRAVYEKSSIGIALVNLQDGRILQANEKYCEITGRSEQELKGLDVCSITHPDDVALHLERLRELAQGRTECFEMEKRYVRPDGSIRWGNLLVVPMWAVGKVPTYVMGMVQDITERKQAEEALRESEARNRLIVDTASEGIWLSGADLRTTFVNARMVEMLGYRQEEMLGRGFADFLFEEDVPDHQRRMERRHQGTSERYERRLRGKDGQTIWCQVSAVPILDEQRCFQGSFSMCTDITDRKQAEEALRQSEADLKHAQAVAHMGSWRYDIAKNSLTLSDELYRIMGLPAGTAIAPEGAMEMIFSDDHERIVRAWTAALESGQFDQECRALVDGAVRLVHLQAQVERDAEGRPVKAVGTVQDITERRQAEERLRQGAYLLSDSQRVAHIGSWSWEVAVEGRQWSEETYRIYGVDPATFDPTPENFLGLLHPEDRPLMEEWIGATLAGEATGELEFRIIRRDGSIRTLSGRGGLQGAPGEAPARMVGTVQDITERKRMEKELRTREEQLRLFVEHAPAALAMLDREMRYLSVSRRYLAEYGRGASDLRGVSHYEIFPAIPERWKESHRRGLAGEVVREENDRFEHHDGSVRWVRWEVRPWYEANGEVGGIVIFSEDITERKQAEEALRNSEAELREAQRVGKMGSWYRNLKTEKVIWTEQVRRIFGMDASEPARSICKLDGILAPEFCRELERAMEVLVRTGAPDEHEAEFRRRDGTTGWVLIHREVDRDEAGNVVEIRGIVQDITERKRLEEELRQAKEKLAEEKLYLEEEIDTELGVDDIVGRSKALRDVMEQVAIVAGSDATVLLLGETGTGKELLARALHRHSQRQDRAFIKMNCAAIPSGLLESELFGYEKGAFTGAAGRKAGRLELADGGTLFLDEISEISLSLQPKLLRVLQDREFERLGGTRTLKSNFRLIAATNRDLLQSVTQGQFRKDLYYRINVFPIRLPSLRERREDILLLVEHFVRKFARRLNKSITSIPQKTMEALRRWDWPGNIRELENFIERSVILTRGSVLECPLSELFTDSGANPNDTLETIERRHILNALRESGGQLSGADGAAARLGLKRTTLQSKLKQFGIDPREFREDRRNSA